MRAVCDPWHKYAVPVMRVPCRPVRSTERARTICDMVRRRESKKRQLYRLMQKEFLASSRTFASSLDVDIDEMLNTSMFSAPGGDDGVMSKPGSPA